MKLQSYEKTILKQLAETSRFEPVSENKLQFATRWVIDKSIQKEKSNYIGQRTFQPIRMSSLPRNANLKSSHHFFELKLDGKKDILKLKCRLVPHGNRDRQKDYLRTDSVTTQFVYIRTFLSIAVLLGLRIDSIDISGAYLQAGDLPPGSFVYMKPPKRISQLHR